MTPVLNLWLTNSETRSFKMANKHICCRPSLQSGLSFNGHIVLMTNLDDNHIIKNVLSCNKGDITQNDIDNNIVSVQLEPTIWRWLEKKLDNKLTQYGFARITEQGIKDDYYQLLIKEGHLI